MANIADVLNSWNEIGVFSYVIPFLLIFAVVFAILDKTKLLSGKGDDENKGITAIIAISIALLALQFDLVSTFFAMIFPRLGIGISVLLVVIILVGFFMPNMGQEDGKGPAKWVGWAIAGGVIIWAIFSWGTWTTGGGGAIGGILSEYIWAIVVLGIVGGVIFAIVKGGKKKST